MEGAEETRADGAATVTAVADVYAVDLFAGPGGWDEGLLELGIRPVGVEWDDSACLTRAAAGHATVQADVSVLDPAELVPAGGHVDLLIGSPPCPTFSAAGGGSGHRVVDVILECLDALRDGRDERQQARAKAYEALLPDAIAEERARAARKDRPFRQDFAEAKARRNATMSVLVVEPFRYALELRPRWIALEQVPPVLPIWERTATDLRALGWNVWTGLLSSERFGVPQTRERAILLADLERPVAEPRASHQRYVPPRKEADHDRLFDPGRRERIVVRGEEHLLPWVSMASALGWAVEDKPSRTLCGHHTPRWLYGEQQPQPDEGGGISVHTRGEDGSRPNDIYDATTRPSRAVTGRAYSLLVDGVEVEDGIALEERQEHGASRAAGEPAPTLTASMDNGNFRWVQRERSGDRSEEGFDPDESPAQALTSKARSWRVRNYHALDPQPHAGGGAASVEFDPDERPARTVTHRVGGWEVEVEEGVEPPTEEEIELVVRTGNFTAVARDADGRRSKAGSVPYERGVDQPAPTLDTAAGHWTVRTSFGEPHRGEDAGSPTPEFDPDTRPSRTIVGKTADWQIDAPKTEIHRVGAWEVEVEEGVDPPTEAEVEEAVSHWALDRPAPTIVGGRRSKEGMLAGRQLAPGEGENVGGWGYERPSTTVAGDPRVPQPGHKMDAVSPGSPRRMQDAVRLSVPEASILQGFRPDYPWQGSRTAQFTQIGNAVPPPLARACIARLLG